MVERFDMSERIAEIGSYELDVENETLWWSDEVYRIAGIDSENCVPSLQLALDLYHPDDRADRFCQHRRSR
jgi:two-component system CheB/CheR fusion protein